MNAQSAQHRNDDAQIWENVNADKHLSRSLIARFSHEGRFTDNATHLTYYFEDFGMEYKLPFWHLAVLADYVYIRKYVTKIDVQEYWDNRHQYYTALTWGKKFGKLELHDRQMIMGQVKEVKSSIDGKIPDYYLRNKFAAQYHFNYYWSVYAAEEVYYHMTDPSPDAFPHINRMRYFVGGYYKVNNHHEFELYYLFEQHMHETSPPHNYVFGIGYSYSFDK
ncbi:MAG TPA: DUF2490 domain-containing protein [Bacteroidia bacterium]|jgi:hypothetical protein|nr:DUF2490 domain-containing protein [Bacteroidia bacterium]